MFDLLANLDEPYNSSEAIARVPITDLMNTVKYADDYPNRVRHICPLTEIKPVLTVRGMKVPGIRFFMQESKH